MKCVLSVFVCLLALSSQLLAQQGGQITGRVTDPSGAIVPAAPVTVANAATGVSRTVETNSEGYYTVAALQPGEYRVSVAVSGFRPVVRPDLTLTVDQVQRVDFSLAVGQTSESVEIRATAGLLDTSTTTVSAVIPNQKIMDLPLNGRNPMALANLVPGVRALANFGGMPVSSWNTGSVSIGGGAPVSNSYMLDGVANEVSFSGSALVSLSVDATEEFRIITHNPSAAYGRSGGGYIAFVSKSGTNEYHGTAYEFLRNRAFNANGFFANRSRSRRAQLVFNQYGATLGGPVKKNKTFFFFNWEEFRQRTESSSFFTVPSARERTGDFSQTYNSSGQQVKIYDPYTTTADAGGNNVWTRQQFPGNAIPASRINPIAAAVAKYYPTANLPGNSYTAANNFYALAPNATDKRILGIKLDHNFTPGRRISGRYTHDSTPWGFPNYYGNIATPAASDRVLGRKSAMLGYTDAIRPDLLVEGRVGFNRYINRTITRSYGFDLAALGFPSSATAGMMPIFPNFSPGDVSAIGALTNDHIVEPDTATSASVTVTKYHGGHTIAAGFESRVYRHNTNDSAAPLSFSAGRGYTQGPTDATVGTAAGYGFASFLLGTASGTASRTQTLTSQFRYWAGFVQDDWKAASRLTLNLGLRWDADEGMTDRYNAITNFDPDLITKAGSLTLKGGAVFPGVNGLSRGMRGTGWTDFQPRVGFAYELTRRTSVRGGFGTTYLPGTGIFVRPGQTGFSTSTSMVGSYNHLPYDTLSNPFPQGIAGIPGSSQGGLTALGSSISATSRNMRRGYVEEWNLTVQREFGRNWMVELGYMGKHGVKLPASRQYSYLSASQRAMGPALLDTVANPYYGTIGSGSLSLATVDRATLLRPYSQFSSVTVLDTWANSNYHAFTLRAEKRFSAGVSALVAYTWSKLIDDSVGAGANNSFSGYGSESIQDYGNLRAERAVSTSNLPHRVVVTASWALPVAKSGPAAYRYILGGWQTNSIVTLQSGNPIGIGCSSPTYGGNRPDVTGDPSLSNPTIEKWFNTAAFTQIAAYTMGNVSRNLPGTRTDSLFNWDFSLLKSFAIRERLRAQIRGEFFNFTNHPTWGMPGTNLSGATFGIVSGEASTPRRAQVGLKFIF